MKITSINRDPEMNHRIAAERERFADAFRQLEADIFDLTRSARLASEQLNRAVGELAMEGEKYTEIPDRGDTELAIFAVDQTVKLAQELNSLWLRLHNEAVDLGNRARGA